MRVRSLSRSEAGVDSRPPGSTVEPARPDAFISYAREQKDFVAAIDAALKESGKRVWVDWKDIRPTADWRATVRGGIDEATAFIFVLSPESLASEVCHEEFVHAVDRAKRIIPVVRYDVDPAAVAAELGAPNWIFMRQKDDFAAAVTTLVDALETDLDWIEAHARLLGRAVEWRAQRSDRGSLLRGRDLALAERWLAEEARHRERATDLHREFVQASRAAAQRRRRRLVGIAAFALAGTVALALVGWQERQTARSRSLAADAIRELATDPWEALRLAADAEQAAHTAEAVEALRRSLDAPRERAVLRTPEGDLMTARFTRDSAHVVTTGYDRTVRRWSLDSGRVEAVGSEPEGAPEQTGRAVDVSPDGRLIMLALGGGVVRNAGEDALRRASPGGGVVRVVDANGGAALTRRPALFERADLGEGIPGLTPAVQFSRDGRSILAVGYDGTVRVWPLGIRAIPDPGVLDAAIGTEGQSCVTVHSTGVATAWSCRTGAELRSWTFSPGARNVPLSPGEVRVAVAGDGDEVVIASARDGFTSVWNARSGRRVASIRSEEPYAPSYSDDGRFVLVPSAPRSGYVIEAATGRRVIGLGRTRVGVGHGEFAADGARLVTSHRQDPRVHVWETGRGRRIATIGPFESPVEDVDMASDGRTVVTASGRTARLWDAASGAEVDTLRGHTDLVLTARFSPDGAFVATSSADGTARVWDRESGSAVAVRAVDGDAALGAALARDGSMVAVGLGGSAWIFDCGACRPVEQLARSARAALAERPA